ncbi:hypothetical protein LCGC14_1755650 [marine sediment metagenome]|uniref:Uncharacterized protein n=1 Tax=marine sediment metagenome TaxID=412755 RepID=A0A0F9K276_9ZZZZ
MMYQDQESVLGLGLGVPPMAEVKRIFYYPHEMAAVQGQKLALEETLDDLRASLAVPRQSKVGSWWGRLWRLMVN